MRCVLPPTPKRPVPPEMIAVHGHEAPLPADLSTFDQKHSASMRRPPTVARRFEERLAISGDTLVCVGISDTDFRQKLMLERMPDTKIGINDEEYKSYIQNNMPETWIMSRKT